MPLDGLQRALGSMVAGHQGAVNSESLDCFDLTADEKSWLQQIDQSKGFGVTCYVQRSWRELGIGQTASLTLSALGPNVQETIDAYLATVHCQSFYSVAEAIAFLDFVVELKPKLPHVVTVARFERAVLLSAQEAGADSNDAWNEVNLSQNDKIKQNPAASIIDLRSPPEKLLGALTLGQRLPPECEQLYPILVAPRLQYFWRPATLDESRLFARCQRATSVKVLRREGDFSEPILLELLRIGALSVVA